jgi:hypothetical protein
MAPRRTIEKARALRRTMTPPEIRLWAILRSAPGGIRFRRQRLASIATLNSSFRLRAAQLCQYIGKCGSELPAWLDYPPNRLRLNDEESYTSVEDRHRILIETLTHSCGQGRREKDGLEIN